MLLGVSASLAYLVVTLYYTTLVHAQPSPQVQKRITAAIKAAAKLPSSEIDYTQFVNVFIGTDNYGDVWQVLELRLAC